MREYRPDRWCLVKIPSPEGDEIKVLGGWVGGYLASDHWRISSGVVDFEDNFHEIRWHNHSGSQYVCRTRSEGLTVLTSGILHELCEHHGADRMSVEEVKAFLREEENA